MELLKVKTLEIENLENAGCNNGNYPTFTAVTFDGKQISGITCRCGSGCSGTTPVKIDYSGSKPVYYVGR